MTLLEYMSQKRLDKYTDRAARMSQKALDYGAAAAWSKSKSERRMARKKSGHIYSKIAHINRRLWQRDQAAKGKTGAATANRKGISLVFVKKKNEGITLREYMSQSRFDKYNKKHRDTKWAASRAYYGAAGKLGTHGVANSARDFRLKQAKRDELRKSGEAQHKEYEKVSAKSQHMEKRKNQRWKAIQSLKAKGKLKKAPAV